MPKSSRRRARPTASPLGETAALAAKGKAKPIAPKKDRRLAKRDALLERLEANEKLAKIDESIKKDGVALGTIGSLADVLKSFEATLDASIAQGPASADGESATVVDGAAASPARPKPGKRHGAIKKRQRKKIQLAEVSLFKQVLSHPAVKKDAYGAIGEHLRNTFASPQKGATGQPAK